MRGQMQAMPAIIVGSVFGLFAGLWIAGSAVYGVLLANLGIPIGVLPFLDTHGMLASVQCHRAGVDVYAPNPCDVLGRPHDYAPALLHLSLLPVTVGWTLYVGVGLVAVFLLGLLLLPPAPGRLGAAAMFLAGLSPPVLFAMERGNLDLLIFAVAALAASLSVAGGRARAVGYLLVTCCAALKYYPVLLLVLAVRERFSRALLVVLAAGGLLVGLALLSGADQTVRALALAPTDTPASIYLMGARNLPLGLAELLGWSPWAAQVMIGGLAMMAAGLAWTTVRGVRSAVAAFATRDRAFLLAGAALLVGCFFLSQNVAYRGIDLLLVLPGLMRLSGMRTLTQRIMAYTTGTVLFLLWHDALGAAGRPAVLVGETWILAELAWWWTIAVLGGVLAAAILASPAMQPVLAAAQRLRLASVRAVMMVGTAGTCSPVWSASRVKATARAMHGRLT